MIVLGGNVHVQRERRLGHVSEKTTLDSFHAEFLKTRPILFVFGARGKFSRLVSTQPSFQQNHPAYGVPSEYSILPRHGYREINSIRWPYCRSYRHQNGQLNVDQTVLGGEIFKKIFYGSINRVILLFKT